MFTSSNDNTMMCVDIQIIDDLICEDDEIFSGVISSTDPDVSIIGSTATVVIADNDGK